MAKRSVFAIAVSLMAAALVACGGSAGKNQKLSDSADSLSYVIGMNIAYNIMKMDSTLRPEVIMAGLADAMQGQEKISLEDGKFYLLSYMNYDVYERVRKYEDQYLTDLAESDKDIVRSRTGLTYKVGLPAFVYAPVEKGEALGKVVFFDDGKAVASWSLVAEEAVSRLVYEKTLSERILSFFGLR